MPYQHRQINQALFESAPLPFKVGDEVAIDSGTKEAKRGRVLGVSLSTKSAVVKTEHSGTLRLPLSRLSTAREAPHNEARRVELAPQKRY